jgi:hypothetical protein
VGVIFSDVSQSETQATVLFAAMGLPAQTDESDYR